MIHQGVSLTTGESIRRVELTVRFGTNVTDEPADAPPQTGSVLVGVTIGDDAGTTPAGDPLNNPTARDWLGVWRLSWTSDWRGLFGSIEEYGFEYSMARQAHVVCPRDPVPGPRGFWVITSPAPSVNTEPEWLGSVYVRYLSVRP